MLLTKECDYGVRIIRTLADGKKCTVAAICEEEFIPKAYAYKILKKLEKADLIQGLRGRCGGYQILKSIEAMTLYDIVTAIDENLFIFECLSNNKHCPLHQQDNPCAVHLELERLQTILVAEMQAKTMREVLESVQNKKI